MAPTTTSSKPAPACRKCGKPGYSDAAGKMQHEKRADPAAYGGRRADPNAKTKQKQDEPPDREHPLNRKIFGGTGRTE